MSIIERQLQRQIWLSVLNGCAYAAWQGAELSYFGHGAAARGVSALGALVWVATLALVLWPLRAALGRAQAGAPDERIARNATRAMLIAYYALIIAIAALFPAALALHLEAIDIARMFAIVAVATPAFAFAIFEALDGRE